MPLLSSENFFRILFTAVLLVGVIAGNGVAAGEQHTATDEWEPQPKTSITAQLQDNGDARWQITTTINLSSENETEQYRELAADFRDSQTPTTKLLDSDVSDLGIQSFQRAAQSVNAHTDREMAIENIERQTATDEEIASGNGTLTIEFTWTNFARAEDNKLVIDDALVTPTGEPWLQGLSESSTLAIVAPPEYGVFDSADGVSPQQGVLRWEGEEDFTAKTLQATFIGTDDQGPDSPDDDPPDDESAAGIPVLLVWGLVPVAAIGVLVAVYVTRSDSFGIKLPAVTGTATESGASASSPTTEREESHDSGTDSASTAPEPEEFDEELLSDEERVERLLASNGGRMKQANIVKETDWSNAKVSQLLSAMEEEGRINKLRIGRENLISFPDEEITDFDE